MLKRKLKLQCPQNVYVIDINCWKKKWSARARICTYIYINSNNYFTSSYLHFFI